ncbi:DNA primase [Paenibacillus lautus]|uniref:DNA primase n=1 Tax=Paenibacillus lautus TaxID=1401 RepID=UPI001C7D25BC|nr:DNA primase [Paenibacillus lautus]MBX4152412.1 DNA primase [Paenibacillus lautus]
MTDSLKQLKERIYNEGTIGQLLEELDCDNIKINTKRSGDDLVTARLPGSKNNRGVQIYHTPALHTELVGEGISGDIYSLVGFLLYECREFDEVRSKLYQIKTHICNLLGYEHTNNDFVAEQPKKDWNWWLRDVQSHRPRTYEVTKNPVLDQRVLDEFISGAWEGWVKEGIDIKTQIEYGVGYHIPTQRVTIPVHNVDGELIGIKGRYCGNDPEISRDKKYNYIYPCSKTIELFNLHRSLPYIKKTKKVYILEGAKSCMQLWSWGIKNSVSIEGDRLSPVQAMILKGLGIDIDYVFAWDKGKDKDFIINQIKPMKNRLTYYLYDSEDLFADKQSPVDKGIDTWNRLNEVGMHRYQAE